MGGVSKVVSKGLGIFEKITPSEIINKKVLGEDKYHQLTPLGNMARKQAAAADDAAKQKTIAEDQAQQARDLQYQQMAQLNDEENRRIKKLLLGGRYGTRGYTNSPLFRQAAGARSAAPPSAMSAAGGASGAPQAAAFRAGGIAGGGSNYPRTMQR